MSSIAEFLRNSTPSDAIKSYPSPLTLSEQRRWAQAQLNVALKEEQQAQGALSLAQAEVRRCREKLLGFVE